MEARLASETDLAGFREEARVLLSQQVPPEAVQWQTAHAQNCDLFADPATAAESRPQGVPKAASAIVPASFLRLCEIVVLHHDADRFSLLYRLLWRLVHEPGLRHDPIDADMLHAHQMGQAVRRDIHKMKAFVRFHDALDGQSPAAAGGLVRAHAPHRRGGGAVVRQAHAAIALGPLHARAFGGVGRPAAALRAGPRARRDAVGRGRQRRLARVLPPRVRRSRQGLAASALNRAMKSLAELKAATMACRECPIGEHATQSVIGEGAAKARLMLVGEQPGDQEDVQGHPFVGPAGKLLARALEQAGIPGEQVFVSNAVKHFKFELRGKRRIHKTPTQREAAACLHWLEDEIALVEPEALVALGATAARSLLGARCR